MPPSEGQNRAAPSPPPLWGRDRVGGSAEHRGSEVPPSLAPPQKGEGDWSTRALNGAADPDGAIWQGNAFQADAWSKAVENEPLPEAPVILSKTRWLAERERLARRNAPLGLLIAAGETVDDIAADLPRFALLALGFPKFVDGRAFSTARLLREKHGFVGELRAVGNVLADQLPYMRRCGFDSFEVTHGPTRRVLAEGRVPEVTLHYQPSTAPEAPGGTRPWLRRGTD